MKDPGIPGWLPMNELEFLYQTVLQAEPTSCLELGSFMGRSTYTIAKALKDLGGSRTLVAVDRFNYKQYDAVLKQVAQSMTKETKAIYEPIIQDQDLRVCMEATQNLYPFMKDIVEIVEGDTQTLNLPGRTFELAFIDADHRYEGVRKDIASARKHMPRGGLLCFHDYEPRFSGVIKAVDELLREESATLVGTCDTLRVVRLLGS